MGFLNMNDSQFEAPADQLNRSGTRPPSAPLEQALSTEQAAHAALPWLRMWVQAGVTTLPISTRPTAAEDGNASAEHSVLVEDWMSYWSQNMVAPMAAAGCAAARAPRPAPELSNPGQPLTERGLLLLVAGASADVAGGEPRLDVPGGRCRSPRRSLCGACRVRW